MWQVRGGQPQAPAVCVTAWSTSRQGEWSRGTGVQPFHPTSPRSCRGQVALWYYSWTFTGRQGFSGRTLQETHTFRSTGMWLLHTWLPPSILPIVCVSLYFILQCSPFRLVPTTVLFSEMILEASKSSECHHRLQPCFLRQRAQSVTNSCRHLSDQLHITWLWDSKNRYEKVIMST